MAVTGTAGGSQLIGGQNYVIGSPEWQAAIQQDRINQAGVSGTAAGTALSKSIEASQPALEGLDRAIAGSSTVGGMSDPNVLPLGASPPPGSSGYTDSNGQWHITSNGGGASGGPSGSMQTLQIAPTDFSAANAAEFAKAKDQVGQESSGALSGLRSALAGRGLLGSGSETRGTTNVITKGQQELGDVSRQQAVTGAESAQKNAEANLQAGVSQRGQDITREANVMEANARERERQTQVQLQQMQMAYQQRQSILQGLMGALGGAIRSY